MREYLCEFIDRVDAAPLVPPVRLTDVDEVNHEDLQRHLVRRGQFGNEVADSFRTLLRVRKP